MTRNYDRRRSTRSPRTSRSQPPRRRPPTRGRQPSSYQRRVPPSRSKRTNPLLWVGLLGLLGVAVFVGIYFRRDGSGPVPEIVYSSTPITVTSTPVVTPISLDTPTVQVADSSGNSPPAQSNNDVGIPDYNNFQQYFLKLINQARTDNGLTAVEWDGFAATIGEAHAIEMVANQYLSHWNLDGLGPDIRYGLAGGKELVQENVYSFWQRYDNGDPYPIQDWQIAVEEAHQSLMDSPGHRANILNPDHTHVGVGMAYDANTGEFRVAQEFINRYVNLDHGVSKVKPGETITISGQLLQASFDPIINLAYEPYPQSMSIAALDKTSTYQSPAQTLDAIPVTVEANGNFRADIHLGSDPGLYHIYVWVSIENSEPHAIDWIITVDQSGGSSLADPSDNTAEVEKAPDFSLSAIDGSELTLSQYQGDAVMVVFFATWCTYCQDEAEILMSIYEEYNPQGLRILAVNTSDNDDLDRLPSFVDTFGWQFPVLLDKDGDVSRLYNRRGVPMNIFIDRRGAVAQIVSGSMSSEMIASVVQQILEE
jgi:uncharacterized protein YkwD/peroxiredoxin